MTIRYRDAHPDDAAACIDLRGRTRENAFSAAQLAELGITTQSWAEGICNGDFIGRIACDGERMVGYGFADRESGEVLVLALLPEYENLGIGRRLLQDVVSLARDAGHHRLFLACSADPRSRSHGFYRHLGWCPTGEIDETGDEILELR
ncbi:GNAT family N-acetyltransferase [Stenotrophomonas maltophilia]|uniref:GNAT family N-acetyltransferase n=1 Tax=Stenotrophomonas maltophilia TaxID=40324 RepID=UPI0006AC5282|nr:GNAT family N-acetyltransferase [Stenotrophomonas maltophilia]KOQ71134.1 acetyltransferase [Stenotrophomonas maltophilia]MCU1023252.1 GNAT family N-acetyltransferase [Stenotrophomonas maltophilia]